MYKVKLTGNYNVYVQDLNFEFTPIRPEKNFSDEEFENSEDIKSFLGKYLEATKGAKSNATTVVVTKKVHYDVQEVPSKKDKSEEKPVINATNASKTTSADVKKKEKTLEEEKKGSKDDTIVDATNASSTNSSTTKSTNNKDENLKDDSVVVADGASKTSATTKNTSATKAKKPASKTTKKTTTKSTK